MQSSHNTTDFTTGDQVHAALLRKLKTASAIITRSNLDSGEYVISRQTSSGQRSSRV